MLHPLLLERWTSWSLQSNGNFTRFFTYYFRLPTRKINLITNIPWNKNVVPVCQCFKFMGHLWYLIINLSKSGKWQREDIGWSRYTKLSYYFLNFAVLSHDLLLFYELITTQNFARQTNNSWNRRWNCKRSCTFHIQIINKYKFEQIK